MATFEIEDDHSGDAKRRVDKAVDRALRMIGGTIAGYAADLSPVDTGLLRNSITFALSGQRPNIQEYHNDADKRPDIKPESGKYEGTAPVETDGEKAVYIGTNVEYAPYQELGAPNINLKAQPFLRPAAENHKQEIEQIMRDELRKI